MGTRGYRVYRFRGRYYALYNHWDSYPEGLGADLIATIPTDPEEYKEWLQTKRAELAEWDRILQERVLSIDSAEFQALPPPPSAGLATQPSPYHLEPRHCKELDQRLQGEMAPSYRVAFNDLYIEWVYTIDLDNEVFSVDNAAHFVLNRIPRDVWIESLALDRTGGRLVLPHMVPPESLAALTPVKLDTTAIAASASVQGLMMEIVNPKRLSGFPQKLRHGPLILDHLWVFLRRSLQEQMSFVLKSLTTTDFAFREIAFGIVSLAAGLTGGLRFEDTRRLKRTIEPDCHPLVINSNPYGHTTVLSNLAIGYHLQGVEPGSAPHETWYWFLGVLISLESDLSREERVDAAIRRAVCFGRLTRSPSEAFNAILISIEHAVTLRVVGNHVQHTRTLPLLQIPIHYTENPLDRYDAFELSNFDNGEGSEVDEDEDTGCVSEASAQDQTESRDFEDSGPRPDPHIAPRRPDPVANLEPFSAMVHVFEAAIRQTMKPEQIQEGVFPVELYEMILAVVDNETYQACAFVSHKFRSYCLQNLRILPGAIVRALVSPTSNQKATADGMKTEEGRSQSVVAATTVKAACNTVDLSKAEFVLEDQSTGFQSHHALLERPSKPIPPYTTTNWLACCGKVDRLSLISYFCFDNFAVPIIWQKPDNEAPEKEASPTQDGLLPLPELDGEADPSHYWSSVVWRCDWPRDAISVGRILQLWMALLRVYEVTVPCSIDSISMPPHTREILITKNVYRDENLVGYVRIKRPTGTLDLAATWEKARSELDDELRKRAVKSTCKQMFGIAAVNLSARLFRYDPEKEKLTEVVPRELQLVTEGDREIIESFVLDIKKVMPE